VKTLATETTIAATPDGLTKVAREKEKRKKKKTCSLIQ